jgi:elongation factor G
VARRDARRGLTHMTTSARPDLISLSIEPNTPDDAQKLARGLKQMAAEQPPWCGYRDAGNGRVIVAAMHEQQLEVVVDRLKREFDVEAGVGRPQIAYREAITQAAEGEMKYARQSEGRGHYAHVKIRLHPGAAGGGYAFENCAADGTIPAQFIEAVDQGVRDALSRGVVAGYPIEDARVELHDGSYHDVDSTEAAFRIAASGAGVDAARKAQPVLLEPVMMLEADVHVAVADGVIRNIESRRGKVERLTGRDDSQVIRARVPLAQLFGYATDFRSRTRGRGTFKIRFGSYEPVPSDNSGDGSRDSLVGAPLKPSPPLRHSSVALPEPDEDQPEDLTAWKSSGWL